MNGDTALAQAVTGRLVFDRSAVNSSSSAAKAHIIIYKECITTEMPVVLPVLTLTEMDSAAGEKRPTGTPEHLFQVVPRWREEARERTKTRNCINQRNRRAKLKKPKAGVDEAQLADIAKMLGDLDVPQVDEAQLAREAATLEAYLAKPGRSQGALKGKNGATSADLMETRRLYLAAFAIGNPGYGELAKLFTAETGRQCSRDQARRIVEWFRRLEAPGGPWSGDR